MENNKDFLFISYSSKDMKFVDHLADDLMKNGVNVWLDRNEIEPGTPWDKEIRKALKNTALLLHVISNICSSVNRFCSKQKAGVQKLNRALQRKGL